MKEFVISEAQAETAVLVGLVTKTQDERKTNEYLDELAFLAETAGAEVVKRFTQKLDAAHSVTYVGKGKLEEIKEYIRNEEEAEREIGMVIFDDELSAKQIRNIEAELKIKILDRTSLILDIFAMRAQTANAKTQVELAQYKYMLPRLQRLWTHLERQGGGSGAGGGKGSVGLRGPGETQLEMDRRIILNRMSLLKERLAEIDKQKSTQRKNRGRLIRVALVGYTNVGKSTLFNVLAGDKISIVKDTPGVTRDRIYADVDWLDRDFTLIDTGGIEPDSSDIILSQMRDQAQIAIDTANVIIFITDVRQGLVDADAKVADMLRRSRKPVVLVVNKVDNFDRQMMDVYEFYNLGIGEPHAISASGKLGIGDMLDEVTGYFDPEMENEEESEIPRIAIVGKPNVGKSSLVNKLLGSNRVIVSDIAGTTRDAIDTTIMHNGNEYIFIDTAGLRKKNKIKEEIERYSIIRAVTAVERADVVIIVIDATEGVTEQDAKIAGIAHDRGKGIIIAVNKWDAIEKDNNTVKKHTEKIRQILSFMPYAEILFISAKSGQRLNKIFEMIDVVIENNSMRVATGVLNEIVTEAVAMQQPPTDKGKRLKIYYVTQVAVKPPTFVVFVNDKNLMHFSYTRYLENRIRDTFGFRGTALKFITRERKED